MLELKDLCFSVPGDGKRIDILNHIDLTVPDGKLVVITGPNGSGKSTLARVIMGIEKATAGSIIFNGEAVENLSVTERAKRGISYGFQQPPRFKGMKVCDLLECAAGRKLTLEESCQYLAQVGLCSHEYVERDVDASLSGGELKRIEIATILARKGELMIFDEPEAGIDLWSFGRLTETFQSIHRKGNASMIIISHQERIIRLADEVVMISGGRVAGQGSAEEMLEQIQDDSSNSCTCM
jgi:Fe-S cluster assembly ATP-binding protein